MPKNVSRMSIHKHCSVRIANIADNYGLTTIGQLQRMLSRMNPNAKLNRALGGFERAARVSRMLEREIDSIDKWPVS